MQRVIAFMTDIYILLAMMLSGLEIVCSVVVLNFHHRPEQVEISPFIHRIILGRMAMLLGVHRGKKKSKHSWKVWDVPPDTNHSVGNGQTIGSEREEKEEVAEEEEASWIHVAGVIDRLFFYLFLFLTLAITTTCLLLSYLLPKSREEPLAGFGYYYYPPGEKP